MNRDVALLVLHGVAVFNALLGLVFLIPYPHVWNGLPGAPQAFAFGMEYFGSLHIVFGALAMLSYGAGAIGARRTAIFFVVACAVSLTMELLGTGTGWPFGAYSYTLGLGSKVLGRVPWSIPLSWFYMGFVSYLLGAVIARRAGGRFVQVKAMVLGVWLLMAWDLTLDPAMAHPDLPVRFWVWSERGAYLGMPLVNLVGWVGTGVLFMGLSRLLWGGPLDVAELSGRYLFALYAVNVAFGVVLCASLGLWMPIVGGCLASLGPASLALRTSAPGRE